MATLKFYLNEPKSSYSSIFFRLNYGAFKIEDGKKKYLPLQYHIDEKINPIYWNKTKGEAKRVSAYPQHSEFNTRLEEVENIVYNIFRKLKNDGITPNHDILRKEFDSIFKRGLDQTETFNTSLMLFIPHFINTCIRSIGTKKSYTVVYNNLKEYEKSRNVKLSFDSVDMDFHNDFIAFLESKNYSPNTIGTRIKILKTFMNEAYERDLHSNLDFRKRKFTKPSEPTKGVYLNPEELKQILELDLSQSKKYDNVRDWFLIASWSGLRYSDLERLTMDNFKDNTIEITTKKTINEVIIPLNPIIKSILNKHDFKLPKIMSNQKFNEYIKDIAEKAGIVEDIIIQETKGTKTIQRIEKKFNLVSAHTARRSFATNAYLGGVPTINIMKITGHETEKAFLSYIKISKKENADKLQAHSFFS